MVTMPGQIMVIESPRAAGALLVLKFTAGRDISYISTNTPDSRGAWELNE